MNDNLDEYLPPEQPAPEKPKRGRPAGKKVAASRVTGGAGKTSRSVGVHVRFTEVDFRRIAAAARSDRTSDPDMVRQLVRKGLDFDGLTKSLREINSRLRRLEAEIEDQRWKSMVGRLRWFETLVGEIHSGSSPLSEAIARNVLKAMLEHDARVRSGQTP